MARPIPLLLIAALAPACVPDLAPAAVSDDPATADSGAPGPAPTVTEETVPDQVLDNDHVFSQDRIHEIAITLSDDAVAALAAEPYEDALGDVVIDGVAVSSIGVRLRGKIGSFRTLDGKPKFELDFNAFIDDQRFYGLESLSLNNSIVDCSYLKEPLAMAVFAGFEVAAPRAAYASVTVNGADYGLYVIIETEDDRFLRRHWGEPIGNLYDGKYVWYADGSYTLLDFAEGHDLLYQLEEGTDVGHADLSAVSEGLAAGVAAHDVYARLDGVVDWEQLHRVWAVEQFIGQNDGYALNKNNYRPYFPEPGAPMVMIPWDYDYSFLEDVWWSRDWRHPRGNLVGACWADADCAARHREVVAELLDAVDGMALPVLADRLEALTSTAVVIDPRRECSTSQVNSERERVADWLTTRGDALRTFWELE